MVEIKVEIHPKRTAWASRQPCQGPESHSQRVHSPKKQTGPTKNRENTAPARASAMDSKGLRPLPPTPKKQIAFEFKFTVKLRLEFDFDLK